MTIEVSPKKSPKRSLQFLKLGASKSSQPLSDVLKVCKTELGL